MAGRIPQSFIDEVLSRIDIIDIIQSRLPLKKSGSNYHAKCPFHTEKTPSFTVSQTKQFYHCFGCGAHGNAIGFLIAFDGLSFPDALETLASSVSLSLPKEARASIKSNKLYPLLQQVALYYQQQLRLHPQAKSVIDYLKNRGLTGEMAKIFGLGYAPPGWNHLREHFGNQRDTIQLLHSAGLIIESHDQKSHYDRFRNRIIFPIRDGRGRVIGFGARALDDEMPKYINSPETSIYHKGQELYGLYEAKQSHRSLKTLLIVEGYMDVIALAQHGITNAVATMGTATTREQVVRLFRNAPKLVFSFDGDSAGLKAALRACDAVLSLLEDGREVSFVLLPNHEDPDSLIRKMGKDAFEKTLDQALPLSQFLFEQMLQQVDRHSLDGKAKLVKLISPSIAKLPIGAFKSMMHTRLSDITGLTLSQITEITQGPQSEKLPPAKSEIQVPAPLGLAITLLLQHPELAQTITDLDALKAITLNGMPVLITLIEQINSLPNIRTGALLERWRNHPMETQLFKWAASPLPTPQEHESTAFHDTLKRLLTLENTQKIEVLFQKLQMNNITTDEKQLLQTLLGSKSIVTETP